MTDEEHREAEFREVLTMAESDRALRIIRHMTGVSVVDAEYGGCFGVDLATNESRVDRALRLHDAYIAAREASREATSALTDEEFKEFRERVGR